MDRPQLGPGEPPTYWSEFSATIQSEATLGSQHGHFQHTSRDGRGDWQSQVTVGQAPGGVGGTRNQIRTGPKARIRALAWSLPRPPVTATTTTTTSQPRRADEPFLQRRNRPTHFQFPQAPSPTSKNVALPEYVSRFSSSAERRAAGPGRANAGATSAKRPSAAIILRAEIGWPESSRRFGCSLVTTVGMRLETMGFLVMSVRCGERGVVEKEGDKE